MKRLKDIFKKKIVFIVITLLIGFLLGFYFQRLYFDRCPNHFSFINEVFACSNKNIINKKGYEELRGRLISYIDEQKNLGTTNTVSMFFRDLQAGPTMGINERDDFIPASLLKLPNALILLRLQEQGEINISKETLSYKESISKNKEIPQPDYEILPNISYTIGELISRSLIYSDNLANRLLLEYIKSIDNNRNLLSEIYRDLGIVEINDSVTSAVNTKGYSSIFRMLFNSSFLNSDSSERLLNIMSKSLSIGGLRFGVPENIKISHKYGERVLGEGNNQLHDCGIIYYPDNPYLLCVMTKGRDLKNLEKIIGHISGEVYKEFDSRRLKN